VTEARFEVEVSEQHVRQFAELSGDFNPLHTDSAYAAGTSYRRPILHGAFSAALVSRMAGMHIPGTDCLLHAMQLRFLEPVIPPARLVVHGKLVSQRGDTGKVHVTVSDGDTGLRYVDASYEFGRHGLISELPSPSVRRENRESDAPVVLVTGATGGIGRALIERLGSIALGVSRQARDGMITVPDLECIGEVIGEHPIKAIVHSAWPPPDNTRLTALGDPRAAVEHHVGRPLRQMIRLGQLLVERGTPDAVLVLIGSTAADAGRHNYRGPLYSLGKSLIPPLCRILAVELGATGHRCVGVVFDVVDAGMNERMNATTRVAHQDRAPSGRIPTAQDAADQLAWVIDNTSFLMSGATVTLSGGALP
jgi:acyl dehydratase/NAD(P)-dependent dehydrogenase (short-subunit alcohol dehydrogenase family)